CSTARGKLSIDLLGLYFRSKPICREGGGKADYQRHGEIESDGPHAAASEISGFRTISEPLDYPMLAQCQIDGEVRMSTVRIALVGILASVCIGQRVLAQVAISPKAAWTAAAEVAIAESALRGHVRFLADDALEGRGPGSKGDEIAQKYVAAQLETLGV